MRGCDSIAKMFGELVGAMEQDTNDQMRDFLGDLFEGAISYGEHGQFMTPMPVCEMMARLTTGEQAPTTPKESPDDKPETEIDVDSAQAEVETTSEIFRPKRFHDPCCGSGRMLLTAAMINRHWEFVGQDVDLRCVRMTALNLAFRNLYGYVIWGDSLGVEEKLIYRTGFDGCGVLREIPLAACPALVHQVVSEAEQNPPASTVAESDSSASEDELQRPRTQLRLF